MSAANWQTYAIYRRIMADAMCRPSAWILTAHTLRARTACEARKKLVRMFARSCLTSLQLVAVPSGTDPNT